MDDGSIVLLVLLNHIWVLWIAVAVIFFFGARFALRKTAELRALEQGAHKSEEAADDE